MNLDQALDVMDLLDESDERNESRFLNVAFTWDGSTFLIMSIPGELTEDDDYYEFSTRSEAEDFLNGYEDDEDENEEGEGE